MVGITSHGKRKDLVPKVIASGNDMILFAKDFQYMKYGVETGVITKVRLNDAITRILALKAHLKLPEKQADGNLVPPKSALKVLGSPLHKQWAVQNAEKSITLVKDIQNLLPISPQSHKHILLIRTGDFNILTWKFKGYLEKAGFKVTYFKKGRKVSKEKYNLVIYLVTENPYYNKTDIKLKWSSITMHWYGEEIPSMLISLASPYHLYDMPRIKTMLNAYFPFPVTQKVVVDLLVGKKQFQGQSPVDPFCGLFDAHL
jgi:beta-N-acetylhexosaminidase